jgi:hypothetical protein
MSLFSRQSQRPYRSQRFTRHPKRKSRIKLWFHQIHAHDADDFCNEIDDAIVLSEEDCCMRFFHFLAVLCLVGSVAASAQAQYGLYGSPEVIRVSQADPYQSSYNYDTAANGYGNTPNNNYPGIGTASPQATVQSSTTYRQVAAYQPAAQPIPTPPGSPTPVGGSPAASTYNNATVPQDPNGFNPTASQFGGCNGYGTDPNGCCGARGDACGLDAGCEDGCSPWYGSLSALTLGRGEGRRLWTSYQSNLNTNQLTNTQDIHMPWAWGGEITVGRRFCCGCDTWALEGKFWTTNQIDGFNSTTSPYYVSTPLQVRDLTFGGAGAIDWFTGAQEQRLWRRDNFCDAEISLIHPQLLRGCNTPWDIGYSFGFRYFRFNENLVFGSLRQGGSWSTGSDQAYLNDTVTNNMFGAQLGFDLAYRFGNKVRVYISPKFGVYDNSMDQNFKAYLGSGTLGLSPYGYFPVESNRNAIAFLSEVDLGLDWQFTQRWSARIGYRLIALNGIAQADDQFPQYIVDQPEIAHIDNHSSLILQGIYAGIGYNF